MRFTFSPMTETDARSILTWSYEGPYAVYNMENDEESALVELLDPRSPYFAARDEHGELVGFFVFGTSAEVGEQLPAVPTLFSPNCVLSVGLGLRPDLTGQGHGVGVAFVTSGLEFARERFHPAAFRLFVLAFNQRAMRVYERAGFVREETVLVRNAYGERAFLEMRRDA